MLGGIRPDSSGIYEIGDSWKISKRPNTHPTLPKYFNDQGYRTLSFWENLPWKRVGQRVIGWSEGTLEA